MTLAYAPPAAPAADVAHHCDKGSRDCFPHDLTSPSADGRGSGRIATASTQWYRVTVGGYEMVYTAAGEPMGEEPVIEGFNLELTDSFMGFGHRQAIEAEAAARFPGKEVIEFYRRSAPATEF